MGVAAYNRGSHAIRRSISADQRPVEFQKMDDLNAMPKYEDAGTPFDVIHFVPGQGGWWAMCPTTGFGYWYKTLPEAVKRWRVTINEIKGEAWVGEPMPPRTRDENDWILRKS